MRKLRGEHAPSTSNEEESTADDTVDEETLTKGLLVVHLRFVVCS